MAGEERRNVAEHVGIERPMVRAHRLFLWGVTASALYVGGLSIYAWSVWPAMLNMKPDEFANFLAGVFAPLAFLWLVLGFRQQGDELQNSANALWLQGEELRNSVEQQRALVEVSREQLQAEHEQRLRAEEEAERSAQPRLTMVGPAGSYSGPSRTLTFRLCAAGRSCSDARVWAGEEMVGYAAVLQEGQEVKIVRSYTSADAVQPIKVRVEYTDWLGNRRAQRFDIPVDEIGSPYHDRTLGTPIKLAGVEKISPEGSSTP